MLPQTELEKLQAEIQRNPSRNYTFTSYLGKHSIEQGEQILLQQRAFLEKAYQLLQLSPVETNQSPLERAQAHNELFKIELPNEPPYMLRLDEMVPIEQKAFLSLYNKGEQSQSQAIQNEALDSFIEPNQRPLKRLSLADAQQIAKAKAKE